MPAEFQFTLGDMFDDSDDAILAEMSRGRDVAAGPLKTTRSMNGNAGNLSILSMNQILMGYPLYNSREDALSLQEAAVAHMLTGSAAAPEVDMNTANFKGELLIPDDIFAAAKALKPKLQARRRAANANATGGAYGNGAISVANAPYPILAPNAAMPYNPNAKVGIPTENGMIMPAMGVPDEVFTHVAMQNTIQDPNSLAHVALFMQLLANQEGDPYNNTSGSARGITTDPNPGSFDCSGYVAWATQQLHLGSGGERLNPGLDIFTSFAVSGPQFQVCQSRETIIDIELAKMTKGALIWPERPEGHIGVSFGDGVTTLEATGTNVGRYNWTYQGGVWAWRYGALNPFINYRVFVPYDKSSPQRNIYGGAAGTEFEFQDFTGAASSAPPGENWGNFARDLLKGLNAPTSEANVGSLLIWFLAEQPPNRPNQNFNPLNIQISDDYQLRYGNYAAGVEAVRHELARDGYYNQVREAMQTNAGHVAVLTAIANSPWAYSRYDPEYRAGQGYPGDPARGAAKLIGWFSTELVNRREELENGRLS